MERAGWNQGSWPSPSLPLRVTDNQFFPYLAEGN